MFSPLRNPLFSHRSVSACHSSWVKELFRQIRSDYVKSDHTKGGRRRVKLVERKAVRFGFLMIAVYATVASIKLNHNLPDAIHYFQPLLCPNRNSKPFRVHAKNPLRCGLWQDLQRSKWFERRKFFEHSKELNSSLMHLDFSLT